MKVLMGGFSGNTADDPERVRRRPRNAQRKPKSHWGRSGPDIGSIVTIKGDCATMVPENAKERIIAKRGDILLVVGKGEKQTKSSPYYDVDVLHQGIKCRIPIMFIKPVEDE